MEGDSSLQPSCGHKGGTAKGAPGEGRGLQELPAQQSRRLEETEGLRDGGDLERGADGEVAVRTLREAGFLGSQSRQTRGDTQAGWLVAQGSPSVGDSARGTVNNSVILGKNAIPTSVCFSRNYQFYLSDLWVMVQKAPHP